MPEYFAIRSKARRWGPEIVYTDAPGTYWRLEWNIQAGPKQFPMEEETLREQIKTEARGEQFEFEAHGLGPGKRHHRINRGETTTLVGDELVANRQGTVAVRLLMERLLRLFDVIEPDQAANGKVYGPAIRELLILAATEFEAAASGVLRANGLTKAKLDIGNYARLLGPMHLPGRRAKLAMYPGWPEVGPFQDWGPGRKPVWYDAYNKVKHEREAHLPLASLDHAVQATAAAFIMMHAQFPASACRELPDLMSHQMGAPFRPEELFFRLGDESMWEVVKLP